MSNLDYQIVGEEWAYCKLPISEKPVFGKLVVNEIGLSFATFGNLWKMGKNEVYMIQTDDGWFLAKAGKDAMQLYLEPVDTEEKSKEE